MEKKASEVCVDREDIQNQIMEITGKLMRVEDVECDSIAVSLLVLLSSWLMSIDGTVDITDELNLLLGKLNGVRAQTITIN